MCERYADFLHERLLMEAFAITEATDEARRLPPNWNTAPTQLARIITLAPDGSKRHLLTAHWGLLPAWAKDPAIAAKFFNASRETVTEKPAFRTAYAKRRCLVPANGYYEWEARELQPGRVAKQPFYIYPADASPLALAGLWETRKNEGAERTFSFTILTTAAKGALARIHERQPVMLSPGAWDAWLDPETPHPVLETLVVSKGPAMAAHPVARDIGNLRVNHPGLISPIE